LPGLFSWALLHSASLEETGVCGVLLDIGGIALLGGIHYGFFVFAMSLLTPALSPVPLWLRLAGGRAALHCDVTGLFPYWN